MSERRRVTETTEDRMSGRTFDDDDDRVTEDDEHLFERPLVVARDLVVTLELLVGLLQHNRAEVRVLQDAHKSHVITHNTLKRTARFFLYKAVLRLAVT